MILHLILSIVVLTSTPNTCRIESLSEISLDQPSHTLFLFDIDDTIFDSPTMLGSKTWRTYIDQATKKIDASANWHDIISLSLAERYPLKAVEEMTSSFVMDLQKRGFVVCGFTSRERKLWYDMPREGIDALTVKQLSSVHVDFNKGSLESAYPDLAADSEYYKGIFFANIEPKGNFLLHLFKTTSHRPEKIIFIDDKLSHVESVASALAQLGILHECYLYSATDNKAKAFYPLIANIQLYYFYASDGRTILSDEEAALIAVDSGKDADYYLRAAIDSFRKKFRDTP